MQRSERHFESVSTGRIRCKREELKDSAELAGVENVLRVVGEASVVFILRVGEAAGKPRLPLKVS